MNSKSPVNCFVWNHQYLQKFAQNIIFCCCFLGEQEFYHLGLCTKLRLVVIASCLVNCLSGITIIFRFFFFFLGGQEFYHRFMYKGLCTKLPLVVIYLLNLHLPLKWLSGGLRLFSDVKIDENSFKSTNAMALKETKTITVWPRLSGHIGTRAYPDKWFGRIWEICLNTSKLSRGKYIL